MPLRKVNLFVSTTPSANLASFTNVTARRLHIRKTKLVLQIIATFVAFDGIVLELAESAADQSSITDSRSLLDLVSTFIGDATGAGLSQNNAAQSQMAYNRGDLVLDPDESLFMNAIDVAGSPTARMNALIYYED